MNSAFSLQEKPVNERLKTRRNSIGQSPPTSLQSLETPLNNEPSHFTVAPPKLRLPSKSCRLQTNFCKKGFMFKGNRLHTSFCQRKYSFRKNVLAQCFSPKRFVLEEEDPHVKFPPKILFSKSHGSYTRFLPKSCTFVFFSCQSHRHTLLRTLGLQTWDVHGQMTIKLLCGFCGIEGERPKTPWRKDETEWVHTPKMSATTNCTAFAPGLPLHQPPQTPQLAFSSVKLVWATVALLRERCRFLGTPPNRNWLVWRDNVRKRPKPLRIASLKGFWVFQTHFVQSDPLLTPQHAKIQAFEWKKTGFLQIGL